MSMNLKNAIDVITSEIKNDEGLRQSYKANIAMVFYDECVRNQVDDDLPLELLHRIANVAADNFLDSWCNL